MSVLAGGKARTGMAGLRTTRIWGSRVNQGRGPENWAPQAHIACLMQIGGPCGIPVHPGAPPTPRDAGQHLQPTPGGPAHPPAAQGGTGEGLQGHQNSTQPVAMGTLPLPQLKGQLKASQSQGGGVCCITNAVAAGYRQNPPYTPHQLAPGHHVPHYASCYHVCGPPQCWLG